MALINCPVCGKQISDRAEKCPGCGKIIPHMAAGEPGRSPQQMSYTSYTGYGNNEYSGPAYAGNDKIVWGYRGIFGFLMLLIFTFGIYFLYWIYKTTELLNETSREYQRQSPVSQLLLCMFVPFYVLFWVYSNAKRIDMYARKVDVESGIAGWALLFTMCGFFAGILIMQDKINEIIKAQQYNRSIRPAEDKVSAEKRKVNELLKLKEMKDLGILTEEEFAKKKAQMI